MLYLEVPYNQKDAVKALGAKWDAVKKMWYVEDKMEYHKFIDWIPFYENSSRDIVCDWLYIVEATHKCFKCKKETKVVCFALQNRCTLAKDKNGKLSFYKYDDSTIDFFRLDEKIKDHRFETYLKSRFGYYLDTSKTAGTYYANHCDRCGKIQGDFYLHEDFGGAFFTGMREESPDQYKLYKIYLSEDAIFEGYSDGNYISYDKNMQVELIPDFKINPKDIWEISEYS